MFNFEELPQIDFEGEFIRVSPTTVPKTWKTKRWSVRAKQGGIYLGHIQWFGRWRCYSFIPAPGTIFERVCLRDIADFLELETTRQRRR